MPSRATKSARAVRPSHTGACTAAPNAADHAAVSEISHEVTAHATVELSADADGSWRQVTWSATLIREMSMVAGEDPSSGCGIRLWFTPETSDRVAGKKEPVCEFSDFVGVLDVAEFRRLVAGLNALAAALPSYPELAHAAHAVT